MNKVVLIGCGNVGMAYAYSLVNQKDYVDELVLIDINKDKAEGEAMDLNHSVIYAGTSIKVKAGDYKDCKDAKIVVIAAGANQAVGETRMDLINKNSKIFKSIVGEVMKNKFDGIFIVATNPLDVMTYLTLKYSGLPKNKVLGTGTTLDTARLRYMIADKLQVCPKDIQAYVIGEHGDSEFIPWSNANIALTSIKNFLKEDERKQLEENVRNAAYRIIEKKGATAYGIGVCLTRITNSILEDKKTILTVSSYDEKNKVCVSTPAIVDKDGVRNKIHIPLTDGEAKKLQHSIDVIKKAIDSIEGE